MTQGFYEIHIKYNASKYPVKVIINLLFYKIGCLVGGKVAEGEVWKQMVFFFGY
jgi:hypothetical protein